MNFRKGDKIENLGAARKCRLGYVNHQPEIDAKTISYRCAGAHGIEHTARIENVVLLAQASAA